MAPHSLLTRPRDSGRCARHPVMCGHRPPDPTDFPCAGCRPLQQGFATPVYASGTPAGPPHMMRRAGAYTALLAPAVAGVPGTGMAPSGGTAQTGNTRWPVEGVSAVVGRALRGDGRSGAPHPASSGSAGHADRKDTDRGWLRRGARSAGVWPMLAYRARPLAPVLRHSGASMPPCLRASQSLHIRASVLRRACAGTLQAPPGEHARSRRCRRRAMTEHRGYQRCDQSPIAARTASQRNPISPASSLLPSMAAGTSPGGSLDEVVGEYTQKQLNNVGIS